MSPGVVPGSGQDGDQPSRPSVPGNGQPPRPDSDPDWMGGEAARLIADVDAGLEQIPDEADSVPGVWFSLAGTSDPAELDLAGFAKNGLLDAKAPDATLAALAEMAAGPGVLHALSDNQVHGLAAPSRTRRKPRRTGSPRLPPMSWSSRPARPRRPWPRARDATRRLPACTALLHDRLVSALQLQIITDATAFLTEDGAAEADLLLAAAAAGLTPAQS